MHMAFITKGISFKGNCECTIAVTMVTMQETKVNFLLQYHKLC